MPGLGKCGGSTTCCVNETVCCEYALSADKVQSVWTNETNFLINGTIVVENNGDIGTPAVILQVDGTTVITVEPDECKSVTVSNMNSIEIAGLGGIGTTTIRVSFSLNYRF